MNNGRAKQGRTVQGGLKESDDVSDNEVKAELLTFENGCPTKSTRNTVFMYVDNKRTDMNVKKTQPRCWKR